MSELDEQLHAYLGALADQLADRVDSGRSRTESDGSDEQARRRTPWITLAAASVVVVAGVAGLFVLRSSDESVLITPGTVAEQPTTTVAVLQGVDEETDDSSVVEGADGGSDDSSVLDSWEQLDLPFGYDFSLPWKGGTLTLESRRVMGPAPEGLLDRYPPEIQELWADGLPTSYEEAEEQLIDAGLGEVGYQTAENDMVLREWFLNTTKSFELTHTVGGVETQIDIAALDVPVTNIRASASNGERFAVAGGGAGTQFVVATTDDLQTWDSTQLITPAPDGIPDEFVFALDNYELAASDWGWVLTGPPVLVGLDPDLLRELGFIDDSEVVVSVELNAADTNAGSHLLVETESKTMQLTAGDLGVEKEAWILRRPGETPYSVGWAAPWGGEPVWTELPYPLCGPFEPVATLRGYYVINNCAEQTAFAVTEDGWQLTNLPPEEVEVASAGDLGLVAGGKLDGVTNPEFWISDNLGQTWQNAELTEFDENVAGLALIVDEWPVVQGMPRYDTTIVVDGYNVVLTHWLATGDGGLLRARVEDPTTGETLATRLFEDAYVGQGGFSLIDASGNVVVEVDSAALWGAGGEPPCGHSELVARTCGDEGPRWRVDTSVDPWTAVRI